MRSRLARYLSSTSTGSTLSSHQRKENKIFSSSSAFFLSTNTTRTRGVEESKMAHKKRIKAPPDENGKPTTADIYAACVEIRNQNGKQPSKFSHVDITPYSDIRIESNVPSSEHKPRWTKETKPKGFEYLKQLFDDRVEGVR